MSIKVSWALKSVPDTLTLYWANSAFTPDSLPANVVNLTPTDTSYIDTTVPTNTTRYYMVKATKVGENDLFSQCMVYGNFPKTGVGSSKVLRGNWDVGLMDVLTPAQVFTIAGLKTALGLATSFGGTVSESTLTNWYKFVYKGKILLIPNAPCTTANYIRWSDLYNAGLIYGVDDSGSPPFDLVAGGLSPAVNAPVNQKRVVTIGSDSYLVRTPRMSTAPTNTELPANKDSFVGGEWWSTMCRMGPASMMLAADLPNLDETKWGDLKTALSLFTCSATPHFFANKVACCVSNVNWSSYIGRNTTQTITNAWVNWLPVLELIP